MKQATFDDVFIEYYQGIIIFGLVMVALAVWIYEFHYSVTSDDVIGLIAACALFFGTILIGQGIRGWRDGEDFRSSYISMKSRSGAQLHIRKKKRKEW